MRIDREINVIYIYADRMTHDSLDGVWANRQRQLKSVQTHTHTTKAIDKTP